jgi:hypothetical protein
VLGFKFWDWGLETGDWELELGVKYGELVTLQNARHLKTPNAQRQTPITPFLIPDSQSLIPKKVYK